MRANFADCLEIVLHFEGGYSDHPSDPGGATNHGITRAVLSEWRGKQVSKSDVKALSLDEARDIYEARYWNAVCGDELPSGIDLIVFDCAVNQGVGRAIRLLQQSLQITPDGKFGPVTLAAVRNRPQHEIVVEYGARRMNAYGLLRTLFPVFGLGWSRRLMEVFQASVRMAL
jgi:lysozyme family protein